MTNKINKAQLGKDLKTILETEEIKINAKTGEKLVETIFGTIADYLSNGDTVDVYGFGKFEVVERSARNGHNPQTGESITIEAKKAPKFKPAKKLKDAINS